MATQKEDLIVDLIIDTNEEASFIPHEDISTQRVPVLIWPNEKLKQKSVLIEDFDTNESHELNQLVLNMLGVILPRGGLALAAPQIGIFKRLIVMTLGGRTYVMVNPEIIESSTEDFQWEEGCLSVPGFFKKNKRPNKCTVKYFDIYGKNFTAKLEGLAAFCVQHEIDHLNGVCFADDLNLYYRSKAKKKINTYKKEVEKQVQILEKLYREKEQNAHNPLNKPRSRKIFPDAKDGVLNLNNKS